MVKYTFLLPAYKTRYLEEAIKSIKEQSYTDFNVIVSDDCSPDNIGEVFDKICKNDSRFIYRRNNENLGSKNLVDHWNLLVDMCSTEYFIMASDDDVYSPNFLEEIDKLIVKYPSTSLFRSRVQYIGDKSEVLLKDTPTPEYLNQIHFFNVYNSSTFLCCEACFCYKTSFFKEKGGYVNFPLAWFTDDATHIKMAENGCISTNDILFSFRYSPISITCTNNNSHVAEQKLTATIEYYKWICNYINKIKCEGENWLRGYALRFCVEKIKGNVLILTKQLNFLDFLRNYQKLRTISEVSRIIVLYFWLRRHLLNDRS